MPKMKTKKSVAKRFRLTSNGKVKYKKQGTRHILTKKASKRKRRLRHPDTLSSVETRRIRKMLPYG